MKNYYPIFIVLLLISSLAIKCSKVMLPETKKPVLLITVKDDTGKSITGVSVRLYKNLRDSGITQLSDSTGIVIFNDLDTTIYYWFAQKGCKTNRISQGTLNRALTPNAVFYGYSAMTETGALKIINNSTEPYKVSDSLINITIKKDTPYFAFRRVRSYLIHSEKVSTPGVRKDSLIKVKCGDTTVLNLPY
ncbi:MAG: hypothetical protein ABIQ31_05005 [Ferruginibacter sp.]